MAARGLVASFVVLLAASTASAATIHGLVYEDTNHDGLLSPGEPGVGGAVVAFGTTVFGVTDASGQFTLQVPDGATGIVWVRVPDGFVPGAVWAPWSGSGSPSLGLHRLTAPVTLPLTFVVASDSHLGISDEVAADSLATAVREATSLQPAPAFFTILGDVTTGATDAQYDELDVGLGGLTVPFVTVPGNHDWWDNGATWWRREGPDNYSFDLAGVHFVVWNLMMSDGDIIAYLTADLSRVDPAMPIVGLTHGPPSPAVIDVLRQLGVSYVLTGHTHSNRIVDHGGVIELNTEPLLMGGIDFTPAGYRVVTMRGRSLSSVHHTVVDQPFISILAPARTGCTRAPGAPIVVAAALDAGATTLAARLDGGAPVPLRAEGGWDWGAPLPALAPGSHLLEVDATSTSGQHAGTSLRFETCEVRPAAPPPAGDDWPQLGGGPDHTGARGRAIEPPLAVRWTAAVGGHVLAGTPAIAGGVVYVAVTDLGDGGTGGIVALDLATGAVRWRTITPVPVRGGVAVTGGLVIAGQIDGTVMALDADTGAVRWRYALAPSASEQLRGWLYGPPSVSGGDLLVGVQAEVADLDPTTGAPRWTAVPAPGSTNYIESLSSVALGAGLAVGAFDRSQGGVIAWDPQTGAERWRIHDASTVAVEASPVIAGDRVFFASSADLVTATDLAGNPRWHTQLDLQGNSWSYATVGTPAYAHGILVVPTLLRDLVALDAATGTPRWWLAGTPSPLRTTHYHGAAQAGFEASPVITGDLVWAADTAGELTCVSLVTGEPRWRTWLGAPVLAGLAVSGDWLVAASYDGTVRALTPSAADVPATPGGSSSPPDRTHQSCDADPPASLLLPALLVLALLTVRTRRRP